MKKLAFIVPLFALAALIFWWLTPHYSAEDEAYYRSVFCAIDHQDSHTFLHDMEHVIEGGNSDYALSKTHYISALGQRMLDTWQQLTPEEQAQINQDQARCRQLMSEKQRSH